MPTLLRYTRTKNFLLPLTLALIILADFLFYGSPLGWDTALFLGIAAAAVALRSPTLWRTPAGRIALALAALILLALVEEPSPLAILMALITLASLAILAKTPFTASLTAWLSRWFRLLITLPLPAFFDALTSARWLCKHPRHTSAKILRPFRWFIPLAAGFIFLLLFILANPIIEQWATRAFHNLLHILRWIPDYLQPDRITLWLLTGIIAYGLLRHRPRPTAPQTRYIAIPPIVPSRPTSAHHFTIRCLIVFNLVFAVQTTLDILYLFGGTKLPTGMTYAQYAHRGAYPLVATAILAALFVLAAFRTNGPAHRSPLARRLVYLWIAQNIFLMASTLFRTWIYIQATLLTELRVAVFIWIFLLALGFVYIIIKIRAHRSNAWLCSANAFTLFAVLYLCAFINFPGLIADFNVRHCKEITGTGASLYVPYLESLGPAALPALAWIRPQLTGDNRSDAAAAEQSLRKDLTQTLQNWRAWTYRRARAQNPM